MTVKMGPKGQVVIPKRVRERLGLKPGDEVVVEAVDGEARVRRLDDEVPLRGMFAGGPDVLADLEADHREELARDYRKRGSWRPSWTPTPASPTCRTRLRRADRADHRDGSRRRFVGQPR